MTWHTPTLIELVLLAGLAYRLTRLAGWDDITAELRGRLTVPDAAYPALASWLAAWRAWLIDPLDGSFSHARDPRLPLEVELHWPDRTPAGEETEGFVKLPLPDLPSRRRLYAAQLVRCPWCAGFWLSCLVTAAWLVAPSATLFAGTIGTLSTVAGLVRKHLDQEQA